MVSVVETNAQPLNFQTCIVRMRRGVLRLASLLAVFAPVDLSQGCHYLMAWDCLTLHSGDHFKFFLATTCYIKLVKVAGIEFKHSHHRSEILAHSIDYFSPNQ